ncbi:hypothetical protein, partial [Streptomyces sp. NPDC059970]|uniref:hypothetical protein n=1 Tax=Streptomyces sp. NPDC059970 TaxID=3347019 RepID=UPI0036B795C8
VKSVFHAIAKPVNRAIDKIVDFIAKKGKALWNKLKKKARGGDDSPEGKQQRLKKALTAGERTLRHFSGKTVGKIALTPLLKSIQTRYGLTSLTVVPNGARWKLHGKLNPEGVEDLLARVLSEQQISDFRQIEQFLEADGQKHQVPLLKSVLKRQAKGGNITGFESWVEETGSRAKAAIALIANGSIKDKDKDQVYDKIAEVIEIKRLSDELAGIPDVRVRFNPGSVSEKSFDIHIEQKVDQGGGYRTVRRIEVASTHTGNIATPSAMTEVRHGVDKLGRDPSRTSDEPTAETTLIIPWNHSSPEIISEKKGNRVSLHPDGRIETLILANGKSINPRHLFDGTGKDHLLGWLNGGRYADVVKFLDAINIVSRSGVLIWRAVNTGARSGENRWSSN